MTNPKHVSKTCFVANMFVFLDRGGGVLFFRFHSYAHAYVVRIITPRRRRRIRVYHRLVYPRHTFQWYCVQCEFLSACDSRPINHRVPFDKKEKHFTVKLSPLYNANAHYAVVGVHVDPKRTEKEIPTAGGCAQWENPNVTSRVTRGPISSCSSTR